MGWYDEAEQGLPPQRHREPTALRQEILDELTDHLALAAERESESGAEDDQQIRARVLKNFGNPAAIARALWWDAMKETIMKDWIQISINAVICIGVVGFMALFYRQMQTTNTALLNALNDRPSAAENTLPSVEFILHRGSIDGALAPGLKVRFEGRPFNEETTILWEQSDRQGRATFGPIRAGQYSVRITDYKTGLSHRRTITLYSDDGTKTIHIPVPPTTPVSLDITAPPTQHVGDTDLRFLMSMMSQWPYEDHNWNGEKRQVIVTSDGTFSVRSKSVDIPVSKSVRRSRGKQQIIQPIETIIQIYGNHLSFANMGIVQLYEPQEDGDEWFGSLKDDRYSTGYENASISLDLQPSGPNSIVLDLPHALLDSYEYNVRLSANSNHGLPDRFSWFPKAVIEEFTDFDIEEARLVEESLAYTLNQDLYDLSPGTMHITVTGQTGHLFSLKNAPKSLPHGYKLLLAFREPQTELDELSASLCAYLETSPAPYGIEEPTENLPVKRIREPIWRLDAKSIDSTASDVLFVDLTDAINNDAKFEKATGILFMWDAPSKNKFRFGSPENAADSRQPVWLIMKPIANDMASNADANY